VSTYWRTIDFRPLPPGWRLVYLDAPTGTWIADMPGLLIQEAVLRDSYTFEDVMVEAEPADRGRRVVAAAWEVGTLEDATEADNFWMVLGPNEVAPDAPAEAEERERRQKFAAFLSDQAERRKAEKAAVARA